MKTRYVICATVFNKQGKITGWATNDYTKSHPIQKHFAQLAGQPHKIYLHAEILALLRASKFPNDINSIEVYRYHPLTGLMQLAKPCKVCLTAMIAFGIKKVNYTTPEGWVYGKTPEEILAEHKQQSTKDK